MKISIRNVAAVPHVHQMDVQYKGYKTRAYLLTSTYLCDRLAKKAKWSKL